MGQFQNTTKHCLVVFLKVDTRVLCRANFGIKNAGTCRLEKFCFRWCDLEEHTQSDCNDQQSKNDTPKIADPSEHVANLCGELRVTSFNNIQERPRSISDRTHHPARDTKNESEQDEYNYQRSQLDNLPSVFDNGFCQCNYTTKKIIFQLIYIIYINLNST